MNTFMLPECGKQYFLLSNSVTTKQIKNSLHARQRRTQILLDKLMAMFLEARCEAPFTPAATATIFFLFFFWVDDKNQGENKINVKGLKKW